MTTRTKIYIALAAAAAISISIFGGAAWSGHTVRTLENAANAERERTVQMEKGSAEKDLAAARYREKTEYLERQIAEITATKRKQDEQLEKLNIDTRNARARVARARGSSATTIDAADLCKKLADAGHPCGNE